MKRTFLDKPGLLAFALVAMLLPLRAQETRPVRLEVDAREAARNVVHSRLTIPIRSGPVTLSFPKWIQGEHAPTGPVTDFVGFFVSANGQKLPWKRDPTDMFSVNLIVPERADELEVTQDFLLPSGASGFTSAASSTDHLYVLNWNQLVLFPKGLPAERIQFAPSMIYPDDWDYGTALHTVKRETGRAAFSPVNLVTLIDSPVLLGRYFRTVELSESAPKYYLHIAADSTAALELKPEVKQQLRNLVAELGSLFGSRPHAEYHFLLSLSDYVAHFGLEHHESTDIRYAEQTLTDADLHNHFMWITAHEVVHSWNGKFRRPAGLVREDPQQPLDGELLWVYEGLTSYLGYVLAARSGLWTPDLFRENLALLAGRQDQRAGRTWRPLVDTCIAAQLLYPSASAGSSWRRSVDFYDEGALIWLEADTIIRRKSGGKKSLDDFCRLFLGGQDSKPAVKPYDLAEIVNTLNAVLPYEWEKFLDERIYQLTPRAPLGGIMASGWKLGSTNAVTARLKAWDAGEKEVDLSFSIGLQLSDDGTIKEVVKNSTADQAGVVPNGKIIAVNGRKWSANALRSAVRSSTAKPIELLVERADHFHTYQLNYRDGERYPLLVRDESMPDSLSAILKPLTAKASP
ncbi:MAG TPA: M61 family peptidase [Verrucomicrobiae bacterium]|nr:M61 family peptidase [Verrucomicrobiae bacterium]